jgi:hypothetical protein
MSVAIDAIRRGAHPVRAVNEARRAREATLGAAS